MLFYFFLFFLKHFLHLDLHLFKLSLQSQLSVLILITRRGYFLLQSLLFSFKLLNQFNISRQTLFDFLCMGCYHRKVLTKSIIYRFLCQQQIHILTAVLLETQGKRKQRFLNQLKQTIFIPLNLLSKITKFKIQLDVLIFFLSNHHFQALYFLLFLDNLAFEICYLGFRLFKILFQQFSHL